MKKKNKYKIEKIKNSNAYFIDFWENIFVSSDKKTIKYLSLFFGNEENMRKYFK